MESNENSSSFRINPKIPDDSDVNEYFHRLCPNLRQRRKNRILSLSVLARPETRRQIEKKLV